MFKEFNYLICIVLILASPIRIAIAATDLFLSEYVEGSSNNKALEFYNGTGSAIDLATDNYLVEMYFNGESTPNLIIPLTGVVANGDVWVLAHAAAVPALLDQADQTESGSWFNGNDTIVLKKDTIIIDVIGQISVDPGTEWGSGVTSTQNNTLRRQMAICSGDNDPADNFAPATQWDGFAIDTFDNLGTHLTTCDGVDIPPQVKTTLPINNAIAVATDTDIVIEFSEAVTVTEPWYTVTCNSSQVPAFTVMATTDSSYTLNNGGHFILGDTCTVTVDAQQVVDKDTPVDNLSVDYSWQFDIVNLTGNCGDAATPIHTIQGEGKTSPEVGNFHTIEGVVILNLPEADQLSGFFVQEEDADSDNNPATSEGIFIYDNRVMVNEGEIVRVSGKVTEYFGLTELNQIEAITICGQAANLPTAATIILPVAEMELEHYEGMRVFLPQTLTVNNNYDLGQYGEITLSYGRLFAPTQVVLPGSAANDWQANNNRNQIILDDGRSLSYPEPIDYPPPELSALNTLRNGDTVTAINAVLGYSYGKYRLYPTQTPSFTAANPRITQPLPVGGQLKVASFNVANYFNGDGTGGGFPTSRGASSVTEFNRQRDKVIATLLAIEADIIGLIEIENDGYGETSAIQDLVNGLNAATAPNTYAFINPNLPQLGTDQITVGMLYRPDKVTLVGSAMTKTDGAFASKNRPPLAQTFQHPPTGEIVTVVVNHFKSKGSACDDLGDPDSGDGQGNCNLTRVKAANELTAWLTTDPTASGDPDFLIIGDLNSSALEDPITAITSAGYTNLIAQFNGESAYSYVFKGQAGYLDHALASNDFATQVTGVTIWHINADEPRVLDYNVENKSAHQVENLYQIDPFRSSDHDPIVIGLLPQSCDLVANYSPEKRQAYLPYIEMPLYTDIDGQAVATVTGLFAGVLEIPFGFADFAVKELVFLNFVEQSKSCHARFIPEEGQLQIPNIRVPTQTSYLHNEVILGVEMECSATLQQSILRKEVFSLVAFDCHLPN
jgi:predicted extracellular nuclease